MAAATSKAARATPSERANLGIGDLVLIRAACGAECGGATRAELQRDCASLFLPHASGTSFRRGAELAIGRLTGQNLLSETRGRLFATTAGQKLAGDLAGGLRVARETWENVRNGPLVARAMKVNLDAPGIAKALERPEGLAALALQSHFGLPLSKPLSVTDLRATLAVIALEKAFGNKIKTGLGKGSRLPGKTARVLAGQLFKKPKEISSDGKLVRLLAAEVLGAQNDTLDALRLALLRKLTAPADAPVETNEGAEEDGGSSRSPQPKAANDVAPLVSPPPKISRPDMSEFVSSVLDAARPVSEGWPGNKKAFISRVWQAIRLARREWDLTEIAFKSMLAEAHRCGQLVLATADLKDKSTLKDLEESKILYKNTVWHFVRVEE